MHSRDNKTESVDTLIEFAYVGGFAVRDKILDILNIRHGEIITITTSNLLAKISYSLYNR